MQTHIPVVDLGSIERQDTNAYPSDKESLEQ